MGEAPTVYWVLIPLTGARPVARNTYPALTPLPGEAVAKELSMRHALVGDGVHGFAPPRLPSAAAYPTLGYPVWYVISAVLMVRIELTAEDSFAAMRARSKLGMAMAAMINMMATTIKSSIREKPFCLRFIEILAIFQLIL